MEQDLTDLEIAKICSYMRIIDLMQKNRENLTKNPKLKEEYEKLCLQVNTIMESLSDTQRDKLLDVHKTEAEKIAKKLEDKFRSKK